MPERVVINREIVNELDGAVLATPGVKGDIIGFTLTPGGPGRIPDKRDIVYDVKLGTTGSPTLKLREKKDFRFLDGLAGKLRVLFVEAALTDVRTTFGVGGTQPEKFPTVLQFKFDNGIALSLESDRVIGNLQEFLDAL